ncbi:proline-rich protein 4 [Malania oleifera]|uniref:proline-rich protein 4 n=1 Tax=Malania oleifera TaxID=397392 RepID=UPI0025AE43B7|nr:proline-rich protein 4 [Malania oleifera]
MRILSAHRAALLCFWVSLIFASSYCYAEEKAAEVVGIGECADCAENKIKTSQAFSGLHVTIDCKTANGEYETRGVGGLDGEGKFKVSLPHEILEDGKLKEECYAQLHSASATPCPAHNGLESSKIIFKTQTNGKLTFAPTGKLKFSPVTCTSAFLWPHYKYPPLSKFPPFKLPPKVHPLHKPLPKFPLPDGHSFSFPPKYFPPKFKKPLPPPVPIYKPKPPVPIYKPKPPVPIYKPIPPVPIYKPKPPVPIYKPIPPVPIYKPKPPVPIYKPKPPFFKHPIPKILPQPLPFHKKPFPPSIPIYKSKPPFHKTLPPFPKIPPIHKKPFPPITKDLPKLPPKTFHHPKLGYFPPLPPYSLHP